MPTQTAAINALEGIYAKEEKRILNDFFTFLRFQSISAEAEYKPECEKCFNWLDQYLKDSGLKTERWETSGHPTLFASWTGAGVDKPTILLYGHYDVQPVDPLELWESPPFEPTIRDGEIFARGAQDNKGQIFYTIQAVRALLKRDGKLPLNVKFVIEGEEEIGSQGLAGILKKRAKALDSDYVAIVDVGITGPDTPGVTLGFRGVLTFDMIVEGTHGDLHSGSFGGAVYNPIHGICELIAGLRDADGRITIPGFYNGVTELTAQERKLFSFDFDEKRFIDTFGAAPTGGEKKYNPMERTWIRPTIEVNGIWGGYSGTGFKTVIPAKAHAKISCRLVPNQNPQTIANLVIKTLQERCPPGLKCTVTAHAGRGRAIRNSPDSPAVQAFAQAYTEVLQKPCQYILCGGSIPITADLAEAAEGEVVLVGYGLEDDQIHAPNEHFGVNRLKRGFLTIARALEILGT